MVINILGQLGKSKIAVFIILVYNKTEEYKTENGGGIYAAVSV